jgi:hypothetical protein
MSGLLFELMVLAEMVGVAGRVGTAKVGGCLLNQPLLL